MSINTRKLQLSAAVMLLLAGCGGGSNSSSRSLLGVLEETFGALVDGTGDVGIAERCEGGLEQPCVDGNGHQEGERGW